MRTMVGTLRILFVISLLWGCTKPNPEMSAISANLVQMSSISPSPFNQSPDPKTTGYAIFQGRCISIITNFQIKINESGWFDIPSSAEAPQTGESTPSYTYDLDCGDGTYTFWIYMHQLNNWGYDTNVEGSISSIAIRGLAGTFATEPTVYYNSNGSGGGGGGNPATNILISKPFAPNGAAPNECTQFAVYLRDSSNHSGQLSTSTSFGIALEVNGTAADISSSVYSNFDDCSNNGTPASGLNVPANQDWVNFVVRMPSSAAIGDSVIVRLVYTGALTVSQSNVTFTIKDPAVDKFLSLRVPYAAVVGYCYPLEVTERYYGGAPVTGSPKVLSVGKPSEITFYTNSDCLSTLTGISTDSSGVVKIYFKAYNVGAATSGTIYFTATGDDMTSGIVRYDTTGSGTVSRIQFGGNKQLTSSSFGYYSVSFTNSNGTPLPVSSDTAVSINATGLYAWIYPSTNTGGSANQNSQNVMISAGDYYKDFVIQPLQSGTMNVTASFGSISGSQTVTVSP